MKTAGGLCRYCRAQLGRPYWWGCFGQRADGELLRSKRLQYPRYYEDGDFETQLGQKVHDCVGLIKGYRWCESPEGPPRYNASEDVAVRGLYAQCSLRGDISSLPEEPGVCLFSASLGHVGVYMGGGRLIEAMGHRYGVVESRLAQRDFALWGKPDWIVYSGSETEPGPEPSPQRPSYYYNYRLPLIKEGMQDGHVLSLRALLALPGGDICDRQLRDRIKSFQRASGLEADGEAGIDTWTALLSRGGANG